MADLTVADVLDRAADLLEHRGWHQGWYVGLHGCLCAAGALAIASGGVPAPVDASHRPAIEFPYVGGQRVWFQAWDVAAAAANRLAGVGLTKWNDAPGRTAAEVKALLRDAAAAQRAAVTK